MSKQKYLSPCMQLLFVATLCLLMGACATWSAKKLDSKTTEQRIPIENETETLLRQRIVDSGRSLLGRAAESTVTINGRRFTLDCSGTVSAIYWGVGIDISGNPGRFTGNGVSILFQNLQAAGSILKGRDYPQAGDIIFWDNTWDRNGNGKFGDDPLTHVGLVIEVDDYGTIQYLHANYRRGIVIELMNLRFPDQRYNPEGKQINSGMYMGAYVGNPANPPRWLAGDLCRSLADAVEIKRSYSP